MGRFNELLKATVAEQAETRSEIKLAGGQTLKLAAKPLRPIDLVGIKRAHPDFMMNPNLEGMVDLMIAKCREADGDDSLVFDARDRPLLLRMESTVITSVFSELFGSQLDTNPDEEVKTKKGN